MRIWTQGERFGTIGAKRGDRLYEITTHRAEAYAPTPASPTWCSPTPSRPTCRGATSRSTPWRWPCPNPSSIDPYGGAADLAAERLRTPLTPEESFSDDPLRMLRAARFIAGYDLEPDAGARRRGRGDAPPARDRVGRADPRRARQADPASTTRPPGCGSSSTPAWPTSSCPSCRPMRLEQDPIHRHKDVLAHTIAVVENVRRGARASSTSAHPPGGAVPRRRQAEDPLATGKGKGVTFHHHEVVGARMTRERHAGAAVLQRRRRRRHRLVDLHLRFHTYRMGWTDSAVRRLRARRRRPAGRAERADPLRLHDPQRAQGPAALPAHGRARGAHRRAARRRRSWRRSAPDLDGNQVMEHLGLPPGPSSARRWRSCSSSASRRARSARRGARPARRLVGGALRGA